MIRLAWLVLLLGGCDLFAPSDAQVTFDKQLGAAYGTNACDCRIEGGGMSFLCTSDGDTEFISFDLPVTPGTAFDADFDVNFEGSPAIGTGHGHGGAATIGEPMFTDYSTVAKIRKLDGVEFSWEPQEICNTDVGCQAGTVPIHSGLLMKGHGGCEDLFAD